MERPVKYEKAWSDRHNCKDHRGHIFQIINDQEKVKEIRKQFPQMTVALWECSRCGKITESM